MSLIHKFQSFENKNNPYAFGWNSAADHADKVARTQAFGAIRRAAEEARMCDKHKQYTAALAVRDAIRAAIESDKS